MIENPETHALQPFDFSHLIENVPKIKKLDYEIDNIQFNPIDSSDMDPIGWAEIAKAIAENYDLYDGFVVLHGTDTMAYTASALSFMLLNLNKPSSQAHNSRLAKSAPTERKTSSPRSKSPPQRRLTARRWCAKSQSSLKTTSGAATARPR